MAGNSRPIAWRRAWIVCAAVGFWLSPLVHAAEPQSASAPVASGAERRLLADIPDEQMDVGLLTIAPGDIYWQRFGHNAIVLRGRMDPARVVAVNYGIFDFGEKNFLLNFLRGRMHYFAVAVDPGPEVEAYARAGRGMGMQWLNLSPHQIGLLRARLERDTSAAHARYRYDYFTRNCSTRVRDALDIALGGALERNATTRSRGWTFRQHSLRLARPDLPLAFGIHLGLAGYTDRPLTLWQEAFVPQRLADALAEMRLGGQPVVARTEVLSEHRVGLPDAQPPSWRWAFGIAGAALAALLWALRHSWADAANRGFSFVRGTLLLVCGVVGFGLLVLWFGTDHIAAHRNLNILVLSPFCLPWLLASRGRNPFWRGLGQASIVAVLASLALALWFAFTDVLLQDFADWLLLLAPALLVLARAERARTSSNSALPAA